MAVLFSGIETVAPSKPSPNLLCRIFSPIGLNVPAMDKDNAVGPGSWFKQRSCSRMLLLDTRVIECVLCVSRHAFLTAVSVDDILTADELPHQLLPLVSRSWLPLSAHTLGVSQCKHGKQRLGKGSTIKPRTSMSWMALPSGNRTTSLAKTFIRRC